jgi:hypothetical protein
MIISSFEGVQLLDYRLLIWDNDQVHGRIDVIENDLNESVIGMVSCMRVGNFLGIDRVYLCCRPPRLSRKIRINGLL